MTPPPRRARLHCPRCGGRLAPHVALVGWYTCPRAHDWLVTWLDERARRVQVSEA